MERGLPIDLDFSNPTIADCVRIERYHRLLEAERFREAYIYGRTKSWKNNMDQKTCIWSDGTCSWTGKSSGIIWVGVQGMDSVCVVTRKENLDVTRIAGFLRNKSDHYILHLLRENLITEVEDIADPCSIIRQRVADQGIGKTFAVVSVPHGGRNGHAEASDGSYDDEMAVQFLAEKMNKDMDFSYFQTVQTAASALQHLFKKKFQAHEIQVCVWLEDRGVRDLTDHEVEEHLSLIHD